jgi:hypothetical protein
MFRFFKGKWVGEDELKENEKLIFQEKTNFINTINDKQRVILELKQEIKMLKKDIEWWKKKARIETERSEILAEQYWALKESLGVKGE